MYVYEFIIELDVNNNRVEPKASGQFQLKSLQQPQKLSVKRSAVD